MNNQELFLTGAGFVINFQRSIITKINGTKFPCTNCRGKGTVPVFLGNHGDVATFKDAVCHQCNGTTFDPAQTQAKQTIVDELVTLVETSWIAARDAAKEEKDGTHD